MNRREFIKLSLAAALSGCTFKGPGTIDSILRYSEKTHPLLLDDLVNLNGTIHIADPAPIVCPRPPGERWEFYNGTEGLDPSDIDYGEPNNPGYGRDGWFCHTMCGAIDINAFASYTPSKNIHGIASHIEEIGIGNDIYKLYLDSKKEVWWVNKKGEKVRKVDIVDVGWSINLLGKNTNLHRDIEVVKYGDSWVEFFCPDGSPEKRGLTFPIVPKNSSGDPDLSAGIARYDESNDTFPEITEGAWSEIGSIFLRSDHYHVGPAYWAMLALSMIQPHEKVLEKILKREIDIAIRTNLFSTNQCIDNTPAFMIEEGLGVRLWNPKDYPSITMSEQTRYGDSYAVIFRNFDLDPNRPLPFADTEILKVAVASISKQKIKDYCLSQGMIVERSPEDDFYMLSNGDASEGPKSSRYKPNLKLTESVTVKIAGRNKIVVEGVKRCLKEAGFKVIVTTNPYEANVNVEEKALQYPHYFGKIAWDPNKEPKKHHTWGHYDKSLIETQKRSNWIQLISGTHLDRVVTTVVSRYTTVYSDRIQIADPSALESPLSSAWFYSLQKRA